MHQFGTDFQQTGSARANFVAARSHGRCKCEEVARHPLEARHVDYDRIELGGEGCPPATSEYPAQLGPGRRRAGAFSLSGVARMSRAARMPGRVGKIWSERRDSNSGPPVPQGEKYPYGEAARD